MQVPALTGGHIHSWSSLITIPICMSALLYNYIRHNMVDLHAAFSSYVSQSVDVMLKVSVIRQLAVTGKSHLLSIKHILPSVIYPSQSSDRFEVFFCFVFTNCLL